MKLDFAKYAPMECCDSIRTEHRGGYEVFVLTNGLNEPKGDRKISSKLSKVLIESFLKRPSLKEIAFEKLTEMANSAVICTQTPNFKIQCEYLFLILKGKQIRWFRNGNVKLWHFADGEFVSGTDGNDVPPLGDCLDVSADIYDAEVLDKKDHYIIAASGDFDHIVPLQSIERCVRSYDTAQELLNALLQQYSANGGSQNISMYTLHLPPRRKKSLLILLLIPVIAAIVFFIIGALGKARHATFFSLLRKVIIVVPLTLILPAVGFGVKGVFLAEPLSNITGGVACYITMRMTVYRKLGKEQIYERNDD